MPKAPTYATVSELNKHKKEVAKMIKDAVKGLKNGIRNRTNHF